MEIPFPMMYNKSPIIKLWCRNQLPNLQTDMPMTRFFRSESETLRLGNYGQDLKSLLKVGQTSRSRSLGKKFRYRWKGLVPWTRKSNLKCSARFFLSGISCLVLTFSVLVLSLFGWYGYEKYNLYLCVWLWPIYLCLGWSVVTSKSWQKPRLGLLQQTTFDWDK